MLASFYWLKHMRLQGKYNRLHLLPKTLYHTRADPGICVRGTVPLPLEVGSPLNQPGVWGAL